MGIAQLCFAKSLLGMMSFAPRCLRELRPEVSNLSRVPELNTDSFQPRRSKLKPMFNLRLPPQCDRQFIVNTYPR